MWQKNEVYYSERVALELLKTAPAEKLLEYLLMMTRRMNDGK